VIPVATVTVHPNYKGNGYDVAVLRLKQSLNLGSNIAAIRTCHGDGGSGAVYGDKLIGLTNFVVGACGSRYPDVFVRLSSFYDWIQEQIA